MICAAKIVASTTVTVWEREVGEVLNLSGRKIRAACLGALLVCLLLGGVLAALTAAQLTTQLPVELRTSILGTSFGSVVMTTGLVSMILCLSSPAGNALQTLLDMLPVARTAAYLGQHAPLMIMGFVFSLTLSSTAMVVAWQVAPGIPAALGSLVLVLIVIVIWQLLSVALFSVVSHYLGSMLRLPLQYRNSIAAAAVIAASLGSAATDVFSFTPRDSDSFTPLDLLLNRVAADVSTTPTQWTSWLLLLGWATLAAVLMVLAASRYNVGAAAGFPRFFQGWLPSAGLRSALVWFEILVAIRNPQIIVTTLAAVPLLIASLWSASIPQLSSVSFAMASAIPVVPALNGLYAVGRTLPTRWVTTQISASATAWITPKLAANFLVCMLLSSLMMLVVLASSLITVTDIPSISARVLAALFMALLAGTLIPYSISQPLSTAAGGFILGILFLLSSVTTSFLGGLIGTSAVPFISLAFAALFAAGFFLLTTKEFSSS
ncbi:hypothetical protein [Acaricomes phytoseiuli]|uniref:hypothetical protein n=1 Tax=Acaricomes phytoseiuli TaxID=291968 RepID=UPI0003A37393|nr:hypothetical protein [Acaricomes phytoseiuli]